jgi:5-formyltetrahydrofolate cyclo-ligase
VAWALDEQWVTRLPIEPHDQPVDRVFTDSRILSRDRVTGLVTIVARRPG